MTTIPGKQLNSIRVLSDNYPRQTTEFNQSSRRQVYQFPYKVSTYTWFVYTVFLYMIDSKFEIYLQSSESTNTANLLQTLSITKETINIPVHIYLQKKRYLQIQSYNTYFLPAFLLSPPPPPLLPPPPLPLFPPLKFRRLPFLPWLLRLPNFFFL